MMEAVARQKAHWLFGWGSEKKFSGRRPQEDMVTSAVFGSIRLLPTEARYDALAQVIGEVPLETAGFEKGTEISIKLWERLDGETERSWVEPDVLLTSGGNTIIVEVKWYSELGKNQVENQISATSTGGRNVKAAVVLGHTGKNDIVSLVLDKTGANEEKNAVSRYWRTWRDVSNDLQLKAGDPTKTPFNIWVNMVHKFLQATDIGKVFAGLPQDLQDPGEVAFRFEPWFCQSLTQVQQIQYNFGE